jgi:hypothetical protein
MKTLENLLETCEAVMIGLGTRRFTIIRRDEPTRIWAIHPRRDRIRDLRPGDEVLYDGEQHVIRSLQVYE